MLWGHRSGADAEFGQKKMAVGSRACCHELPSARRAGPGAVRRSWWQSVIQLHVKLTVDTNLPDSGTGSACRVTIFGTCTVAAWPHSSFYWQTLVQWCISSAKMFDVKSVPFNDCHLLSLWCLMTPKEAYNFLDHVCLNIATCISLITIEHLNNKLWNQIQEIENHIVNTISNCKFQNSAYKLFLWEWNHNECLLKLF